MKRDPLLEDLRRRFRYDAWANRLLADALARRMPEAPAGEAAATLGRAELLLAHVLAAEEVWHARVHGGAGPVEALWAPVPREELPARVEARALAWRELVEGLAPGGLERGVAYRNSRGEAFEQPLTDVLTHVLNHGTHHRGQIVLLLRQAGFDPPVTDYSHWGRTAASAG